MRRIGDIYRPPDFRVTLFTQAPASGAIQPTLRLDSAGEVIEIKKPSLTFSSGMPVAGLALDRPSTPIVLVLPNLQSPREAREFFRRELRLPAVTSEILAASEQVRQASQILCVGLASPLPLVLSIDAFRTEGFGQIRDNRFVLSESERLSKELQEFERVAKEWQP